MGRTRAHFCDFNVAWFLPYLLIKHETNQARVSLAYCVPKLYVVRMRTKSKQLKELATLLNEVCVRVMQICTSRLTEKI